MSRVLRLCAWFILVFLGVFTGLAFAAGAATQGDDGSLLDLAKPIFEAFTGGHKLYAGALALVFVVAVARRYGASRWAWLGSDEGGGYLTLIGSFAGAMATGLAAGGSPSWEMAWTAVTIAVGAAGTYALIKKLVINRLLASKWYQEKAPDWLKSMLNLVLWVFENHAEKAAIKKAEAAGEEAVKKDPPKGMGEITELK